MKESPLIPSALGGGRRAIDRYLDAYDVRSSHSIAIDASPAVTYAAARRVDLGRSVPIVILVAIRGLPHVVTGKARPTRSITFETLLQLGFTILEERRPAELVVGAIGRFWRPDSGLVRVAPEQFRDFDEPGYAKAVLTFTVEESADGSLLSTETRVACTGPWARRKFLVYWRVIGPFSGLIRRIMLQEVKRAAEAATD